LWQGGLVRRIAARFVAFPICKTVAALALELFTIGLSRLFAGPEASCTVAKKSTGLIPANAGISV
jgi:hypothetical protein